MAAEHAGRVGHVKGLGEFLELPDNAFLSCKTFKKLVAIYRRERMLQGEHTWFKATDEGRVLDVILTDAAFNWQLTKDGFDDEGNVKVRVGPAIVHGSNGSVDPVIA